MADRKPFTGAQLTAKGKVNLEIRGLTRKPWRDLYPHLLATTWPRLIAFIAAVYLAMTALFAVGYYLDPGGVENVRPGSLSDAFFFSVQTWATIGYGRMVPVSLLAHVLVSIEAFVGLLSVAMCTGLLFAKFSRPHARVLFSEVAVVTEWDGQRCLIFRLANERGTQIVDAQILISLSRREKTRDGVPLRRIHDLKPLRSRNPSFLFAWMVIHPLDAESPLREATLESLQADDTVISASVTGLDEAFGQTVYARHTYLPERLRWGHDFLPILPPPTSDGLRVIDYTHFHETEPRIPPSRARIQAHRKRP